MIKVLIADDEKKVCQLIVNLVDWESFGFEIVSVVNDGISAYQYLQQNTVNVLITDIRMPGCDGMELIQKTKVLHPDIYIVIISGYSQFDYAQNAIRFGVEDYLLKPIRKKDLTATLKKIADKRNVDIKDAANWQNIQKRLEENEEKVKRSLLEDIVKRPEKFGGFFSEEKINEEYHYCFRPFYYQTFVIKILPGHRAEDADARRLILKKGIEIAEDALGGICNELVVSMIDEDIAGIFNGTQEALDMAVKKLKKVKLDIIRLQDLFEEVHVYIALGRRVDHVGSILISFDEAKEAIQNRFYFCEGLLTKECMPEDLKEYVRRYINNPFKKRFLGYIEIIDTESIEQEMEALKRALENSDCKNGRIVSEVYREIMTLFYFGAHNYNINIPDQYTDLMNQLELCGTLKEAMDKLRVYMVNSLSVWVEEKKVVESRPIRIAKQYIGQNYYKPLTLEIVSKEIGFNPTYFSGVFKKETDMNFSDYLKNVRVENAKDMLLDTGQTIEDISFSVGYSDVKYFSRLFKKLTGVTPTEFRRLYN